MASVTSTYARALADVVFSERLDAAKTVRETEAMSQVISGSKELQEVLDTPSIPVEQKRALVDALVARLKFSGPVRNFIVVLVDHRRIGFLDAITKEFGHEINQRMGFAEADIISARELTSAEHSTVESRVEALTHKKVRARYSQDPSLLGGAIVRLGSTIYDGSVKGQLERIREELVNSQV